MKPKKKKMCPFCFSNSDFVDFDCVEEACAWWDVDEAACALLVLARMAILDHLRADTEGRI